VQRAIDARVKPPTHQQDEAGVRRKGTKLREPRQLQIADERMIQDDQVGIDPRENHTQPLPASSFMDPLPGLNQQGPKANSPLVLAGGQQ
jgi:hypothetical protein